MTGLTGGCASLISDAATVRIVLADIDPTENSCCKYRSDYDTWVYMDPQQNFREMPLTVFP